MADRLADLIPKEDMTSTIEEVHYACEVIEAIDVVFAIGEGTGALGLIGVASKIGGETLVGAMEAVGVAAEGALIVLAPLAAIIGEGVALGMGYAEALQEIGEDHAARGFSRGVVLAVDGRKPTDVVHDARMWSPFIPPNPFIPAAQGIALRSYQMGMVAGMAYGKELTFQQRKNFWGDLIARDRGKDVDWDSQSNPSDAFYESVAVVFRREHLQ